MRTRLLASFNGLSVRQGLSLRPTQGWICSSCRASLPLRPRRTFASNGRTASTETTTKEKPYYITTPIFYVNAAPHVGHLFSMVIADVLKRYQELKGKKAILITGTDEHGMKIQQAASLAGSEPKPFCDKGAEIFKELASRANISCDRFIRTTDPDHREAVEYVWHILQERGFIYESKHEGWYSVSDETFYPQSSVHLILDPRTGRKMMTSIESGKEVEWTSEINHHFRLSALRTSLLEFYASNPTFAHPPAAMHTLVDSVTSSLTDLSVSRPLSRLTWAIPVPLDSTQMIYVWVDALVNYLTAAGYPFRPGVTHDGGWPADVHVIGKDILRFHGIYLPALLLALGLPLPHRLLVHAHWTLSAQKMSKSTGNVVNPFFALDRFGVDPMRFYLCHDGGIERDSDYSNREIMERYKKALQSGLGNLASRCLRGKGWNTREAVIKGRAIPLDQYNDHSAHLRMRLDGLRARVDDRFSALDVSGALKEIMDVIYQTNKYLHLSSPWDLVPPSTNPASASPPSTSTGTSTSTITTTTTTIHEMNDTTTIESNDSTTNETKLTQTIYLTLESLRLSAILLQPFIPHKATELLNMLGVPPSRRTWDDLLIGCDADYGRPAPGTVLGRGREGVLFPGII